MIGKLAAAGNAAYGERAALARRQRVRRSRRSITSPIPTACSAKRACWQVNERRHRRADRLRRARRPGPWSITSSPTSSCKRPRPRHDQARGATSSAARRASPKSSPATSGPSTPSTTSGPATSSSSPRPTAGRPTTTGSTTPSAPKFARTVDIHNKPGYDPVELHFDFATKSIPLDATLVKGSHGSTGIT